MTARFSSTVIVAVTIAAAGWLIVARAASPVGGSAKPLTPDGRVDFNRDIRPILSGHCFRCHGPGKHEADMRLDRRDDAIALLDGIHPIVPGDPDASEVIKRVTHADPDERMPRKSPPLEPRQIELLRAWIKQGAEYAEHWAYIKPKRPEPPKVSDPSWPRNPIDNFVMSRLDAESLRPSPEADRATLIRRLTLDLTGLPPTIEQVDAFVNDTSADAYEKLVDRLLADPAYGEHWARQWLDMARYADSAGYADDPARTIWAYRDYVIRSFNDNKPFDRFTVEQLAGDLLPDPTPEQLTATAFHRNTQTNNEGGTDDEEYRNAAIVDRVNTTFEVWMGTTMACAQCHDHKYDPIAQREFFRFFAILNNTADSDKRDEQPIIAIETQEQAERKSQLAARIAELDKALAAPTPQLAAAQAEWEKSFAQPVQWHDAASVTVAARSGAVAAAQDDGSLLVPAGAATDVYTIEAPLTQSKLSAIRLNTLPHASLPGGGSGHGGGNFVITRVLATLTPPASEGVKGRFVRIELPGKSRTLSLAEVQVFSGARNVALAPGGKATQHSVAYNGPPNLAIDGNTSGVFNNGSVTHTDTTADPWWEVELPETVAIDRVAVFNRTDGNVHNRLDGFRVQVLDEQRRVVWQKQIAKAPATDAEYSTGGARGVPIAGAFADYEQPGFGADNVLDSPKPSQTGWAVGGAANQPHTLTLVPAAPLDVPRGSKLTLTIEQLSPHANHTLGRFKLAVSDDLSGRLAAHTAVPGAVLAALAKPPADRADADRAAIADHYRSIAPLLAPQRGELEKLRKELAAIKPTTTVPVLAELPAGKRRTTHIQHRGNFLDTGDAVTPGLPRAFTTPDTPAEPTRLDMARWLASPDNPLTARVAVNRCWEQLFGIGIVATSEEFGSQGDLPSHPDLLDWLATELVADKWDVKQLIKTIVTSATYRQSSRVNESLIEADPANRLLARGPRFRMSAEMIRDQALAVSGLLSRKMYGPPVNPPQPNLGLSSAFGGGIDWKTSAGEDRYRRGIYTTWRRTSPYPSSTTFDAPTRQVCTVRRSRTNTPLQALVTLNDPVYVEAAQALARRMNAAAPTVAERARFGFRLVLARQPSQAEVDRLVALYEKAHAEYAADRPAAVAMATKPLGPLPDGADAVDLAAWSVVANVLLNLDETVMNR